MILPFQEVGNSFDYIRGSVDEVDSRKQAWKERGKVQGFVIQELADKGFKKFLVSPFRDSVFKFGPEDLIKTFHEVRADGSVDMTVRVQVRRTHH
jgi:hypothetical protein